MLLCGDWVLPISSPPVADGAILVTGRTIGAVGPAAELRARYPGEEVLDFSGCALLPGLVNAHTHLDYSAFRGFSPSCGFSRWILRLLRARRRLDSDDLATSALWGAHECARSGVTAIADTSCDGWTVARAAGAAGLRARVYLELFGLDDTQLPETMERLEAALERLKQESSVGNEAGTSGPPVEWGISPHAPYTVSERLYREAARFARRAGVRMVTHVAESRAEVDLLESGKSALAFAYRAAHLWTGLRWKPPGISPLQYVAGGEALGPDMLVVHAVQVDGEDIVTLADSGATVAHCPRSNQRLRCGVAPVAEMKAAGVTVGLGTDSLASNASLDMFEEMRAALQGSRERTLSGGSTAAVAGAGGDDDPALSRESRSVPLTPAAVLRMATLDGAQALGWDHLVGSLEAGKRADIVAVRLPGAEVDPTTVLVEGATAADVQMTLVDGIVTYEGTEDPVDVARGLGAVRTKLGLGD